MSAVTHEAAAAFLAERDAVLARIIAEVGAPSLRPNANLFESLAGAIVGQQISVRAAAAIRRRLAALMSDAASLTPEGILACSVESLRSAGLSRSKAAYLLDLARKVQAGMVDLEHISTLEDEAIITELTQVKGIGRWTAEMFLIFSLNRLDVLPVADLGFRTAMRRSYGFDHLPTPEEIHNIATTWTPYRSIATWYLWRSLQLDPL